MLRFCSPAAPKILWLETDVPLACCRGTRPNNMYFRIDFLMNLLYYQNRDLYHASPPRSTGQRKKHLKIFVKMEKNK